MACSIFLRASSTSSNVLAARASAALDWMFCPTMMIGSSTSWMNSDDSHSTSTVALCCLDR